MKKIPVVVRGPFWIFSLLIAFLLSQGNLLQLVVWEVIIFVSVLFHELGHALVASAFGQRCRIELVAMGGVTFFEGVKLRAWKQFIITLSGPLFGFLLGTLAYLVLKILPTQTGFIPVFFNNMKEINWFWSFLNLLPILPLDGGQLVRIVFEKFFHAKGIRYALFFSMVIAAVASFCLFLVQSFLGGAIFFFFAYESFEGFRKTKGLSDNDQNEKLKKELMEAEALMQQGEKEKALASFQNVQAQAKQGMIFNLATQYTAFLNYEAGRKKESYEALKMIKESLDVEGLCLLHKAAFEAIDDLLVMELAGDVFQVLREPDVALRNAISSARLGNVAASMGWLETALECGAENLGEILKDKVFDLLRSDPHFKNFVKKLPFS